MRQLCAAPAQQSTQVFGFYMRAAIYKLFYYARLFFTAASILAPRSSLALIR